MAGNTSEEATTSALNYDNSCVCCKRKKYNEQITFVGNWIPSGRVYVIWIHLRKDVTTKLHKGLGRVSKCSRRVSNGLYGQMSEVKALSIHRSEPRSS